MTSSTDSTSSSFPFRKFTYDVFLSFRGTDTRNSFTDHLLTALKQRGINAFRDDEQLERGKSIAPNLSKAIEESRYAIVVLSQSYADSAWCLDELAKVNECRRDVGQIVLPVFYHVDPSEVRAQKGERFKKAFEKHRELHGDKLQRWKDALAEVGNLSGWHLQNGSEARVVEEIVQKVFTELNQIITTSEGFVGMDCHVNEMLSYLNFGTRGVLIIGICGMGGIGKTTIAQVVFERVQAQFEDCCFLENVTEVTEKQGVVHLQQQLLFNLLKSNVDVQTSNFGKDIIRLRLCKKKVLLIVDDVAQEEQLEALCGRTWFGPGSRIIITSRDEHLITAFGADKVYKVNPLTDPEALELFCSKAFQKDHLVGNDFLQLTKEFLEYADGLPLAIKVLGSSVRGRSVNLWSSALKRLKKNPQKRIIDVLKVSFDGLEETEKKTFLDIACFFKGENKDRVIRILNGCDDDGVEMDVQVLMDKSLVTLFGTKLWMHDLIQKMGWEVVLEECREEPGKRSRLWLPNEIIRALGRSKVTSAVQSIFLQYPKEDDVVHSIDDAFSDMDRLRLLKITNVKFSGNIKYLSNELQYLEWDECPLDSFPSDFQPENLVEVRMHFSLIKQLWRGEKGWSMLRHLDLSGSPYLISTPDFTEVPDLEVLILQHCTSLVEVHPSLGFLKKLSYLYMENCKSIESLPPLTTLESLQILRLSGCSGLKKFPEIDNNLKSLLELHLAETTIEELPPSIEHLTGLTMLNLTECKKLLFLPNNIGCLTSLKILGLTGCSKIDEIPGMECLETLFIGGTSIRDLSFIQSMKNLQYLSCQGCKCLVSESCRDLGSLLNLIELDLSYCNLVDGAFLSDFSSLISLTTLNLSGNCFVRLPDTISQLSKLETLHLSNCRQLQLLPKKLPLSLHHLYAQDCTSLTDYPPNQINILNSWESGVIIVDSRDSAFPRNVGESIQMFVTHENKEREQVDHVQLKTLKQVPLLSTSHISMIARDEISEWFSSISTRNAISIPLPQNLSDDKKWKGIAACAIFAVKGHTALSLIEPDPDFFNYSYKMTLETDVVRLKPNVLELDSAISSLSRFGLSSHLLVIFSTSNSEFPRGYDQPTLVRAIFETTNPSMVVQKCGIRLLYEEDAGWDFRITEDEAICLDDFETGALAGESDWLSQSFNWEKIIPPLEEESTVLALRKNLESVLPRYLEALYSYSEMFVFNLGGHPGWFRVGVGSDTWSNSAVMPVELPQKLHKSKKWMGFAIFASLVEEVEQQMNEDSYLLQAILRTGDNCAMVVERELKHVRPLSEELHQLLVIYIPRAQIPESLLTQTLTTTMEIYILISDSPHVNVLRCGFRTVYQEDIQGFSDTIIRCMQRDNSLKSYDKWLVEEWIGSIKWEGAHIERMTERDSRTPREKYFDLYSQKYRNWDWSDPRHPVYCRFKGVKISKFKWFMPFINQHNSADIQLPLNVFDDDNWLGFAVCFQLSGYQYPDVSLDSTSPDSEDHILSLRLDSDVAWQGLFVSENHFSLQPWDFDATWFFYIPCNRARKEVWRQCEMARITVWLSTAHYAVQSCALRLLFKEDVKDLIETLTLAEVFLTSPDRAASAAQS